MSLDVFLSIDLPALLTLLFSVICCSLLGLFLLLRRESMMSDSLSHAVLPGLAVAFLVTGTISPTPMIIGAFVSCLLCVLFIHLVKKYAQLDAGSSLGLVFTSLFALGLFLLENQVGHKVHLDAHHALYGALEMLYWPDRTWGTLPPNIPVLAFMSVLIISFVVLFYNKLKLILFDPSYAKLQGVKLHYYEWSFFFLLSASIVLAFNAVGSILVIALFIAPPAIARMLTRDFPTLIILSVISGCVCVIVGYVLASWAPLWLGFDYSLSAGGMIGSVSGVVLLALVFIQTLRRA